MLSGLCLIVRNLFAGQYFRKFDDTGKQQRSQELPLVRKAPMTEVQSRQIFLVMVFWAFAFFCRPVAAQATADHPYLPLSLPDHDVKPLRNLVDPQFQKSLEARLQQNPLWAKLMADKRLAVGLVDLSDPENVKFARVNGNQMMYAASLPKLAILLAAENAIEEGKIPNSQDVQNDLRIMISQSNNQAATRMYRMVGGAKYIEKVLRNPHNQFYDMRYGGGLWVGRPYAKGGQRYGDPMKNLSHAATATQVCRYYYLLAMGKLINRQRSEEMLGYLVDPELHHKFVNSIERVAPDCKIYRKSGTWRNWHADSMLCWGPNWRRYILVGLVEDAKGEQILRDLVPAVEEVLRSHSATYEVQ